MAGEDILGCLNTNEILYVMNRSGNHKRNESVCNEADTNALDRAVERILAFVDYFNKTMAKPFQWTFTGKPLKI